METLLKQLKQARAPKITLAKLRTGKEIELGRGVSIQAFRNEEGLISFLKFKHPTDDGLSCTKVIPIRQGKKPKKWSYKYWGPVSYEPGTWDLIVGRDRAVSLNPSLLCSKHHFHGYIKKGRWETELDLFLKQPDDVVRRKIKKAEDQAEEFGGGYEGAILALASKQYSIR